MYQLQFTLKQHTPIIHFQHEQDGATLRATEVKPKLDRFILMQLGKEDKTLLNDDEIYKKGKEIAKAKGWFISDKHDALDYKMRIIPIGNLKHEDLINLSIEVKTNKNNEHVEKLNTNKTLPTYFGNMMKLDEFKSGKPFKKVSFYDELKLIFIVKNKSLKSTLEGQISDFFFHHNFGTRQSKGFGSFTIQDDILLYNNITFLELAHNLDFKDIFTVINYYHQRLKSGVNYSYQEIDRRNNRPIGTRFCHYNEAYIKEYIRDKKLTYVWDKKWLKEKFFPLAPDHNKKKFARAFLGLSYDFKFKTIRNPCNPTGTLPTNELNINIDTENNIIQRIKSPITYKPIKTENCWRIYLIVNNEHLIKNESIITNHDFLFKENRNSYTIQTPENLLDIEELIKCYNKKLTNNFTAFYFNGKPINITIKQNHYEHLPRHYHRTNI